MNQNDAIKILVVEDEALVARELELRLTKLGYKVVGVAPSADKAMELAREYSPDLLLMDIHIKGSEDGIDVAHRIKAEREVPVVFLTAYSDAETVTRAKQVAPYGYIIKPVENRELEVAIEIALYKANIEKELKDTKNLLSTALQCIGDALLFVDERGMVTNLSAEMLNLLGTVSEQEQGRWWYETLNLKPDQSVRRLVESAIANSGLTRLAPFVFNNQNGARYLVDGVVGSQETGHVLILRYITEIKDDIEKLASADKTDVVEGVSYKKLITGESAFVLLLVRPDSLSDSELKPSLKAQLFDEIEKCMNHSLRSTDLASSFGDSLFMASLPSTSITDGEKIANSLLRELKGRRYCGGKLEVGFSIGLSHSVPGDDEPFELLRRAALALEVARESGGERVIHWRSNSEDALEILRPDDDRVRDYEHILLLWNVMNTVGKGGDTKTLVNNVSSHLRRSLGLELVMLLGVEASGLVMHGFNTDSEEVDKEVDKDTDWTFLVGDAIEKSVKQLLLPLHEEQLHSENYSLFKFETSQGYFVLVLSATQNLRSSDYRFIEALVDYLSSAFRTLFDKEDLALVASSNWGDENLIFQSSAMKTVVENVSLVAPTDATVLVHGESGTGKELVASLIHDLSQRSSDCFVIVDCGAIVENLIESELFGHVKGAFTGADADSPGRLREGQGGTIFLDEISELPMEVQAKLLRFVQDKQILSVGGTRYEKVDTRVIAATNKNLKELISEGRFREDLYYRLNVFSIVIPPLRERPSDIPAIANHYLKRYAEQYRKNINGFTDEALEALKDHAWPGNVRELSNQVNRSVILCKDTQVNPIHLGLFYEDSEFFDQNQSQNIRTQLRASIAKTVRLCVESNEFPPIGLWLEDDIIVQTLSYKGGVSSKAASVLRLPETTLRRKILKMREETGLDSYSKPESMAEIFDLLPSYIEYADERKLSVIDDCRKMLIEEADRHTTNRSRAANLVGVSQPTYRKILFDLQNSP